MAKGRRLTSSRSERLLGTGNYHSYHNHNHGYGFHENGTVSEVSEFAEEDVWSMVDDTSENYNHHHHEWDTRAAVESERRRVASTVTFRQEDKHVGGLSLAFEDKTAPSSRRILHQYGGATGTPRVVGANRHVATSAPVNVPDWSKILRVNSVESMHDSDEDDRVTNSVMEPPHEYLARSRQKNAFSVFEGVGRTLKGRDMSRVRDAVWSQTGFEG
ncbi:unnamed protein product [Amaranthus hypochondriacus]